MVSKLEIGVALTILAWVGLQAAVVHGRHVVEEIDAGKYDKGPFADRGEPDE